MHRLRRALPISRPALGLIQAAGVAVAYYASAKLGLHLALVDHNVTPVWPPTGIALVALLWFGYRVTPGIAAAALLVNVPISASAGAAAVTAAGNTLAPLVAFYLLRRVGFRQQLDRLRDATAIVFLAGLASMTISAAVGSSTLVLSGHIPSRAFLPTFFVWWTGDAMGVLVVAPLLLSLRWFRGLSKVSRVQVGETALIFLCLALVSRIAFSSSMSFPYLVFPFLIWAVWRFQQRGAAPAVVLVCAIAVSAAIEGTGPFAGETLLQKMVTLQVFNGAVALTSFLFAALMSEREEARAGLERAAAGLEKQIEERTAELSAANVRMQQLDELKTDFLSTVSHELRTPLTSVQGFSMLLMSKWSELPERSRKDFIGRIEANGRRLGRLINELLDFGRLERGKVEIEIASYDLAEEINRVIENLGTLMDSHQVRVRVPLGLRVLTDPRAFTRILDNLLTNAAKFSPPGSQITIEAVEADADVCIGVSDEGPGVPLDEREKIFERFYRIDRRETAGPGTGIGLAVAKQYVRAQGGRIWLEGGPNGGSIFCFTLKRASRGILAAGQEYEGLSAKAS